MIQVLHGRSDGADVIVLLWAVPVPVHDGGGQGSAVLEPRCGFAQDLNARVFGQVRQVAAHGIGQFCEGFSDALGRDGLIRSNCEGKLGVGGHLGGGFLLHDERCELGCGRV